LVEITGGEPMMEKENLLPMIKYLKKQFKTVLLNTNGSLINKSTISELQKAGLDVIKISLYSLLPKIHNQMRGSSIAFDNAMKAIKLTSKSKLKLKIAILITRQNISYIPKLIYYLSHWPKIEITLQPLDELVESKESKNLRHNQLPGSLWPEKKEVLKFFAWAIKNKHLISNGVEHLFILRNYYLDPSTALSNKCFSGQRNLIINPDGGVSLCYKYPPIGNIFKDNLKDILKKEAKKQRLEIKDCKKYCRVLGCNYARSISSVLKNTIKIKQ
jgi:MoaA/NifB/PqqE/SkfB family radical SAM enzyme